MRLSIPNTGIKLELMRWKPLITGHLNAVQKILAWSSAIWGHFGQLIRQLSS